MNGSPRRMGALPSQAHSKSRAEVYVDITLSPKSTLSTSPVISSGRLGSAPQPQPSTSSLTPRTRPLPIVHVDIPLASSSPPIDPQRPFGKTHYQSCCRINPDQNLKCKWRVREKESVWDTRGPVLCGRSFITADLLARHLLQEHVTSPHHDDGDSRNGNSDYRHSSPVRAPLDGIKLEQPHSSDSESSRYSRPGSSKQVCRWHNCVNRSYHLDQLKRHLIQSHLERKEGLKWSCPFRNCPTPASIHSSMDALDGHIARYHRHDTHDDFLPLLESLFSPTRPKPQLKPPPPLPLPGSRADRELCLISSWYLPPGKQLPPPKAPPKQPTMTPAELKVASRNAARFGIPLQPGDDDYLAPMPLLFRRLERSAQREASKAEADAAIDRAFAYTAKDLARRRASFLDSVLIEQDPVRAEISRAISRAVPYQKPRPNCAQVVIDVGPNRPCETLDPRTIRRILLEHDQPLMDPLRSASKPEPAAAPPDPGPESEPELQLAVPSQLRLPTTIHIKQEPGVDPLSRHVKRSRVHI